MPVLPEVGSMRVAPGFQCASLLSIVNDCSCDAILYAACRIEVLQLCEESCRQIVLFFNMSQLQQRSVSNQLIGGGIYVRHMRNVLS